MADEAVAPSLAGETRPLDAIVRLTAERCLRDLGAVARDLGARDLGQEARDSTGGDLGSSKAGGALGKPWVKLAPLDEESRKLALLKYLHCTKQKILRLLVLCRWSTQLPILDRCRHVSSTLAYHDSCMSQAADALFGLHVQLAELRSPMLDVASAMEVLSQHTYGRLPRAIQLLRHEEADRRAEDAHGALQDGLRQEASSQGMGDRAQGGGQERSSAEDSPTEIESDSPAGPAAEGADLEALVWRRLLEVPRPPQLGSVAVRRGRATLRVDGEYEADVTVGYANRLDLWRLLDVRLLVGPRVAAPSLAAQATPRAPQLSMAQKMFLADDIQRRMAAECLQATPAHPAGTPDGPAHGSGHGADPLGVLHNALHALASAVACDQVLSQLRELELMRWKGHIRVEISSAAAPTPLPAPSLAPSALDAASDGPGSPGVFSVPGTPGEPGPTEGSTKRGRGGGPGPSAIPAGDGGGADKAVAVKVWYWLASEQGGAQIGRAGAAAEAGPGATRGEDGGEQGPACIRIELLPAPAGPGRSLRAQLRCSHSPAVVDPLAAPLGEGGGTPPGSADLALDPEAIDVERLLQDAIRCSTHSKLVALQRSLRSEAAALGLQPEDILLTFSTGGGEPEEQLCAPVPGARAQSRDAVELLWVRLLGSSVFLHFSVALRTGCLGLDVPGRQHPDLQELLRHTEGQVNSAETSHALASRAVQGIRALRFAVLRLHLAAWGPSVGLQVVEMGPGRTRDGSPPPPKKASWQLPHPPQSILFHFSLPLFSPLAPPERLGPAARSFALAAVLAPDFLPSFFLLRCAPNTQECIAGLPSLLVARAPGDDVCEVLPLNVSPVPGPAAGPRFLGPGEGGGDPGPRTSEGRAGTKEGGAPEGDPPPSGAPGGAAARVFGKKRRPGEVVLSAQKRARPHEGLTEPSHQEPLGQVLEQGGSGSVDLQPFAAALGLAVRMACMAVKQERLVSLLEKQGIPSSAHQALVEPWQAQVSSGPSHVQQQPGPLATSTLSFRLPAIPSTTRSSGLPAIPSTTRSSARVPGARPPQAAAPVASAWHRLLVDLAPTTEQAWAVLLPVPWFRLMCQLATATSAALAPQLGRKDAGTELRAPRAAGAASGGGAPPAPRPDGPQQAWGGVVYAEAEGLTGGLAWTEGVLRLTYPELSLPSVAAMEADVLSLYAASAFISQLRARLECGPQPLSGGGWSGFLRRGWAQCRGRIRVEALGLLECRLSMDAGVLAGVPSGALRVVIRWSPRGGRGAPHPLTSPAVGTIGDRVSCSVAVAPADLWPHTGFLEQCVAMGDAELLLDAIRLAAGPLTALHAAIHPMRTVAVPPSLAIARLSSPQLAAAASPRGPSSSAAPQPAVTRAQGQPAAPTLLPPYSSAGTPMASPATPAASYPGGPRAAPPGFSSLLPSDVTLHQRSLFSFRLVYRSEYAINIRCFNADFVWLQPAPPPPALGPGASPGAPGAVGRQAGPKEPAAGRGGAGSAGSAGSPGAAWSAPCPQFRPFILEQVALLLHQLDRPSLEAVAAAAVGLPTSPAGEDAEGARAPLEAGAAGSPLPAGMGVLARMYPPLEQPRLGAVYQQLVSQGSSARADLQLAVMGVSDEGGYGGAWVPLLLLKRVLRSVLRYLGTIWLFSRFPAVLSAVLGPSMMTREAGLLSQDPEQPALRFFIGNYVFMLNLHRQRRSSALAGEALHLMLQVVNARTVPQRRPGASSAAAPDPETDMSAAELADLSEMFSRKVAVEPFDASRLASFVTLAMLPLPLVREFLGLQQLKREQQRELQRDLHHAVAQQPAGSPAALPAAAGPEGRRAASERNLSLRIAMDLCLENRVAMGWSLDWIGREEAHAGGGAGVPPQQPPHKGPAGHPHVLPAESRSDMVYNKAAASVDFSLVFLLDTLLQTLARVVPVAGGALWLPHSVMVRLRLSFAERPLSLSLLSTRGSHAGQAFWSGPEWEQCQEAVALVVAGMSVEPEGWRPGWLRRLVVRLQNCLLSQVLGQQHREPRAIRDTRAAGPAGPPVAAGPAGPPVAGPAAQYPAAAAGPGPAATPGPGPGAPSAAAAPLPTGSVPAGMPVESRGGGAVSAEAQPGSKGAASGTRAPPAAGSSEVLASPVMHSLLSARSDSGALP